MNVILLFGKGMKLEVIAPKCHKTFSQGSKSFLLYQIFPVFKGFSKVQQIHLYISSLPSMATYWSVIFYKAH